MNFKKTILCGMVSSILVGCGGDKKPLNQLPILNASPVIVKSGGVAKVKVDAVDSDGRIVAYKWVVRSGATGLALSGDTTDTVTFKAPDIVQDAEIILTVQATDDKGGTSTLDVVVKVQKNLSPTISNSNVAVAGNITYQLTANAVDPDGEIASYAWSKKSGPTLNLSGQNSNTLSFLTPVSDEDVDYVFTLKVTDNQGATAEKDIKVTVTKSLKSPVGGVVVKGTLSNAKLLVYKYVNNQPVLVSASDIVGDLKTDANGDYNFSVLNYTGPLKISAMAADDGSTTMRCDAVAGCLTVNGVRVLFGQDVKLSDLDPNLKLDTITAAKQGTAVTGNISSLTHLAAALISKSSEINLEKITQVKKLVMEIFSLNGDLDSLTPTKVDDPSKVTAEQNAEQLRYGLINSAIANALFNSPVKDGETFSLSARLTAAANDFATNNGSLRFNRDNDAGFELSLAEVLTNAAETSRKVIQLITEAGIGNSNLDGKLSSIATDFTSKKNEIGENVGEDGRVVVVPETPTQGGPLAIAKAMVNDVRIFSNLVERTGQDGEAFGDELLSFDEMVTAAGDLVKDEVEQFTLISELADITVEIDKQNRSVITEPVTYQLADYSVLDGIGGTAIYNPTTNTIKIAATYNKEIVNIEASVESSSDDKTHTIFVGGQLENDNMMMNLTGDSKIVIKFDEPVVFDTVKRPNEREDFVKRLKPVAADLLFNSYLEQKKTAQVPNPVSYRGRMDVKLEAINIMTPELTDENWQSLNKSWKLDDSIIPVPVTAFLSGEIKSSDQNSIRVQFTADILNHEIFNTTGIDGSAAEFKDKITLSLNTSGDKLTVTAPDTDSKAEFSFIAGNSPLTWQFMADIVGTASNDSPFTFKIDQTFGEIASGLDRPTLTFLSKYLHSLDGNTFYEARFIPRDSDNNNLADTIEVWTLSGFINSDNQFVDKQGNLLNFNSNARKLTQTSISDFIANYSHQFYGTPYSGQTSALNFFKTLTKRSDFINALEIKDVGYVVFDKGEFDVSTLKNGTSVMLDAYVAAPFVTNGAKISVSENGLNAGIEIEDSKHNVSVATGAGSKLVMRSEWFEKQSDLVRSEDLSIANVTENDIQYIVCDRKSGDWRNATVIKVETENNVQKMSYAYLAGGSYNDAGQITFNDGSSVAITSLSFSNKSNYNQLNVIGTCGGRPGSTTPAIDLLLSYHYKSRYGGFYPELDVHSKGIARMERTKNFSDLTNGSSKVLGATYIMQKSDETETNFVKLAANLNAKFDISGYEVSASLSALRTGVEDADMNVDVRYSLPNKEGFRRFKVEGSLEAKQYTATNSEGAVLTFDDTIPASNTEVVVGAIKVNNVEIAKILRRGKIYLISYNDETIETL